MNMVIENLNIATLFHRNISQHCRFACILSREAEIKKILRKNLMHPLPKSAFFTVFIFDGMFSFLSTTAKSVIII